MSSEAERVRLRQEALSREMTRRAALKQAHVSSRKTPQLSVDEMAARLRAAHSSNSSNGNGPNTSIRSTSSTSPVEPPPPSPHRGGSATRTAARVDVAGRLPSEGQRDGSLRKKAGTSMRSHKQHVAGLGKVYPSKGAFSEAVPPPAAVAGRRFKRMAPVPKQRGPGKKQPQAQTEAFAPRGSPV